eukprot:Lithocolla_globosa_v1_NODE_4256_length_1477_cov_637.308017.p1 type:complete len:280 gc:universal NODE_4256_length_1477_cov_637.308017:482-1321(+)
MAPVDFKDIGKAASDLMSKDMPSGDVKLELNTKTKSGVTFNNVAKRKESGEVSHEFKDTYVDKENNLELVSSFNSSNLVKVELTLEEAFGVEGLTVDSTGSLKPSTTTRDLSAGFRYKTDSLNFASHFGSDFKLSSELVLAYDKMVLGTSVVADGTGNLQAYDMGVGYKERGLALGAFAKNKLDVFQTSYYYQVCSSSEVGCLASYTKSKNLVGLEFGGKYKLDKDSSVKAKIHSDFKFSVGYSQIIRPGVKATLGGVVTAKDLTKSDIKFGAALKFDL